ncbi:hypothetical protein MKW92_009875 [Papaver armeniacum]|nr:hypothetical protein MKW92_009875 [Papaver armeniacum]
MELEIFYENKAQQPIKEVALGNIPTISFRDTDSPMPYVDIGSPANNKGKNNIGCLFWMLARMVLQMRDTILLGHKVPGPVPYFGVTKYVIVCSLMINGMATSNGEVMQLLIQILDVGGDWTDTVGEALVDTAVIPPAASWE